jgi:hypothetical protein
VERLINKKSVELGEWKWPRQQWAGIKKPSYSLIRGESDEVTQCVVASIFIITQNVVKIWFAAMASWQAGGERVYMRENMALQMLIISASI